MPADAIARLVTVGLLVVGGTTASVDAGFPQSRTARRAAEIEARIGQEPDRIRHYLDLAMLYADEREYDAAASAVTRALERLIPPGGVRGRGAPTGDVAWRSPDADADRAASVRVGAAVPAPRRVREVRPRYPAEAQAEGAAGTVILEVLINGDGKISELRVLRSVHPLLDEAAVEAVRQWEYAPTLVSGRPQPVVMTVTLGFSLSGTRAGREQRLVEAVVREPDSIDRHIELATFYAEQNSTGALRRSLLRLREVLLGKGPWALSAA